MSKAQTITYQNDLPARLAWWATGEVTTGTCLVFAITRRDAKKAVLSAYSRSVAGDVPRSLADIHTVLLRDPYFSSLARSTGSHVIKAPPACETCGLWDSPQDENGICATCLLEAQ